jgi:large conductance mechanosensitive channel
VLREFRDFLLRENLVEIAVGLVIALAFTAVVTSLVEDLITALIAAVLFLLVVKPLNELARRRSAPEEPSTRECPECLSEIRAGARRCAHCTAEVGAA